MQHRLASFVLTCAAIAPAFVGCAHSDPRRFRFAAPITRDQDLDLVSAKCRTEPADKDSKDGKDKTVCAPEPYESSFAWDAADNLVFRPISKFFQAEHYGEAENVNAFDEVPDSSWFTNRIGAKPMTPDQAARGYCPEGPELEANPEDGTWTIDHGKDNGANPGFRVVSKGTKFMFKTDEDPVERATAATAIATRLYYAAGWWAACDAVVYFKRSALKLKPGLTIKANVGPAKKFDDALLTSMLSKTGRRGELYRATASRWLPGVPLGPFTYEGKRSDDPSDVIAHENRRDLRGAKLIAAWLNHFDSREQNSMSTWMPEDPKDPHSRGYVRHWYIDLGDCFGSEWSVDGFSRRHGHSYMFDVGDIATDFATFGAIERPWDHSARVPGQEIFGYFRAEDFDPSGWRGEYPNPAFGRMTELDGAWAARIISRFTDEHVAAAVKVGDFTDASHTEYLTTVLNQRRQILLARFFARLSPIADVRLESNLLCATDLARKTKTYPDDQFRYSADVSRNGGENTPASVTPGPEGSLCLPLVPSALPTSIRHDARERYVVVRIKNGATRGPLVLHLYDLGPERGFRLVGIERPEA